MRKAIFLPRPDDGGGDGRRGVQMLLVSQQLFWLPFSFFLFLSFFFLSSAEKRVSVLSLLHRALVAVNASFSFFRFICFSIFILCRKNSHASIFYEFILFSTRTLMHTTWLARSFCSFYAKGMDMVI